MTASETTATAAQIATLVTALPTLQTTAIAGSREIEGSNVADLIVAGSGSGEIEAGKGNDIVVDLGGSDKIELGKGNDTLIYDVTANIGAKDRVDGGAGTDILVLAMTNAQWLAAALQTDIGRLQSLLATARAGYDHAEGLDRFAFSDFNLTLRNFEAIRVFVDGTELSLADNAVTAVADRLSVAENGSVAGNVLANDTVPDLVRTVAVVSAPVSGALAFNADGSFSFDASQGFDWLGVGQSQDVSFVYQVTDADGDTSEATVTVTITGTNDAPVISGAIAGAVTEDASLTSSGQLTAADVDMGDSVSFTGSASSAYGSFVIGTDGAWRYTLDAAASQHLAAGQQVSEVFTVTATDSFGASVPQDITVTITGTNDAPVISGAIAGAVIEDATLVTAGQLTAADVDMGDSVSFSGDAAGSYGSFVITADGGWTYALDNASAAVQALAEGQSVTETFTVTATDRNGATVTQQVAVAITGTNDAPVLDSFTGTATPGHAQGRVTATDVDLGDLPQWFGTAAGQFGTFTITTAGAWHYAVDPTLAAYMSLAAGETVDDSFVISVSDGHGGVTQYALPIGVTGVNDAPTVSGATTGAATEDTATVATGQLTASDVDHGDSVTFSGSASGSFGTFAINADGAWSYALNNGSAAVQGLAAGQVVQETFNAIATDLSGASVVTPIIIEITGTADISGGYGAQTVVEDTILQTSGGAALAGGSINVFGVSPYGSLTVAGNGLWTFTLNTASPAVQALRAGEVQVAHYTVSSAGIFGARIDYPVNVTIIGTNDLPVISGNIMGSVTEDATVLASGQVTASDVDAGDTVTFSGNAMGSFGAFNIAADGSWTYQLNNAATAVQALTEGQTVTETFTVQATDSFGGTAQRDVTITVVGAADVAAPGPKALALGSGLTTITAAATGQGFSWSSSTGASGTILDATRLDVTAANLPTAVTLTGDFGAEGLQTPGLTYQGSIAAETVTYSASHLAATIMLGDGADRFTLRGGDVAGLVIDGGLGNDHFAIEGSGAFASVFDLSRATLGQISVNGVAMAVTGFEMASYVGYGDTVFGSDLGEIYQVLNASSAANLNGGGGNDSFNVGLYSFVTGTRLDGGAGLDRIDLMLTDQTARVTVDASRIGDPNGGLVLNGVTYSVSNMEYVNVNLRHGAMTMIGSAGADRVIAGTGADILIGGKGADTFHLSVWGAELGGDTLIFNEGDGQDIVLNFDAVSLAHDVIELHQVTDASGALVNSFAQVLACYNATTSTINFGGGDQITLVGVSGALNAADFLFT